MEKTMKTLTRALETITALLLVGMVCTVFAQVICRYIFNAPLNWSEELSKLLFNWMVFLGVPLVTKAGIHIQVDSFVNMLPVKLRKKVICCVDICLILFFVTVVIYGLKFINAQTGLRSVGLNIPMICFSWAVPVGMFFETIFAIDNMRAQKIVSDQVLPEKT